jgi:hypothetical protein
VRGFVGERGELDVCGLALAAGDAATVGVTEETRLQRFVLEFDVVADEEGFQRIEVAVGVGAGDSGGLERGRKQANLRLYLSDRCG